MNKLEELFKEKLSDYAVAPPKGSWEKVEAGLSKKSKSIIWLRWAASLLFGGLLLGSLWLQREDNSSPLAKENQPAVKTNEVQIQKSVPPILTETKPAAKNVRKKNENKVTLRSPLSQSVATAENVQRMEPPTPARAQAAEIPASEIAMLSRSISHGIVLTYTLNPVELPIEDAAGIAEVAADAKRDKSLKRMVDFARSVKNSDSPIGGIRVMKEDLFALELKKKTTSKNH